VIRPQKQWKRSFLLHANHALSPSAESAKYTSLGKRPGKFVHPENIQALKGRNIFLSHKWITCPIEPDMQIDKFSFTTENTEDTEGRKNDRIKKNDEN